MRQNIGLVACAVAVAHGAIVTRFVVPALEPAPPPVARAARLVLFEPSH